MPPTSNTILITGFGPFPGMPENVSGALALRLAEAARRRFRKRRIEALVLPTEWEAAPRRLAQLYAELQPGLALHFGVSERARGFVIETQAHNACRHAADAADALPRAPVLAEDGATALSVRLPVDLIVTRLRELSLPAERSADAGGYICNAVLFHALRLADVAGMPSRAGFVHVPHRIPGPHLDWDRATAGALEILRVCAGLPARAAC
jgi:pyroglutamyl-peptidase